MSWQFTVGLRVKRKADRIVVDAEDALIAALKVKAERPEATIEKYPTRFEIDLLRCVYCGFCVDACPEEAIFMSRENDLVGTSRAEMIIDRDRLMERAKLVEYGAGYRPIDHDVRRPVRIAALERLKHEHGIVPGPPDRP